eukprot:15325666-Ditylum_brightwellii.AAC.1
MLSALKGQSGAKNMVVEFGGEVFKGEADARAWVEASLSTSHLLGVLVDVYVVLKLILLGYTNVKASMMEWKQKLQSEADEALVFKTFKNKLATLFEKLRSDGTAVKMVTSTQDSWLPGITSFSRWETLNCLGGMKI